MTDDVREMARLALAGINTAASNGHPAPPAVIEPLRDFLQRPLPKSESLVGVARNGTNLLPRYGWVMPWGKEGSSKTSVIVDLMFHAACGIPWLHYPIARPLRIVAIINEGVPGGLQDKLQQKAELWAGDANMVLDNIAIYSSPWGEFTFTNTAIADHARAYALDFRADYLALDPLHTLGTIGAGTPQETEQFKHTLRAYGLWDDLGFITAHHSNKNGMVSGDWGRHVDTLIHIEKDGKRPATKMTLEKARPADPDELHNPQILEWDTATIGFRRVLPDLGQVTDADMVERIYEAIDAAGELTITALRKAVPGDDNRIGDLARAEIASGGLVNKSLQKGRFTFARKSVDPPTDFESKNTPEEVCDPPSTDSTDFQETAAQTRMNTGDEVCDPPPQTTPKTAAAPDGGLESVSAPAPRRGAQTQTQTTGQDDRPPPDADLAPEDTIPPPDLDTLAPTTDGWEA